MANPRRAATIRTTRAAMAADLGPMVEHYEVPLDLARLYRWVVSDTSTTDGLAVLGHSGGTVGRWTLVRVSERGADLRDAVATSQVVANFWRVLPAATLTANHVLTVGTTNAVVGDVITVTRLDVTAWTYAIVNGGVGAGTIITMPVSVRYWAKVAFDGTNWVLHSAGQMA